MTIIYVQFFEKPQPFAQMCLSSQEPLPLLIIMLKNLHLKCLLGQARNLSSYCHQVSWSEFDLQDPCRKRELTSTSSLLSFTGAPWHARAHTCRHTRMYINTACMYACMYAHARTQAHRHGRTPYNFKFLSINPFSHLAPGLHTQPPFLTRPCFWEVSQHLRTVWVREPELRLVLQDRGGSFLLVNPDSASCCLSWNSFWQ